MGGKDGSRGYLYQAIVSVVRAFSHGDWDRIYVEFPSEGDKVDIGFTQNGSMIHNVQVKSSINPFAKPFIIEWLRDLIDDSPDGDYELTLIGECDNTAQEMVKLIKKFYDKTISDAQRSNIQEITSLLDQNYIIVDILPISLQYIKAIALSALHQFLCSENLIYPYDCLCFVLDALVARSLELGTSKEGQSKEEYCVGIIKRVKLLKAEYNNQRHTLGIRSYLRGATEVSPECLLDLTDNFNGRIKKEDKDWMRDVVHAMKGFFSTHINSEEKYQILIDAHPTIAFAAGRILDSKAGINIVPIQKTIHGIEIWKEDRGDEEDYPTFVEEHEVIDDTLSSIAVIFNITRDIDQDAKEYISHDVGSIGQIVIFKFEGQPLCNRSVVNGEHCLQLVGQTTSIIHKYMRRGKTSVIHFFVAAPNAFMFYLGRFSRGFGTCQLYDFDFGREKTSDYYETILFEEGN